ncbi:MAG: AAA family ATPase [Dehalococcoidia bacterium]
MKISEIHIKNFKRFKDTHITDLSNESKIVIIVGPNGSGKSSLFDAFNHWYKLNAGFGYGGDESYYVKEKSEGFDPHQNVNVIFHNADQKAIKDKKSMYFRTAYRNDPDFNVSSFSRTRAPQENIRFQRLIDNDQTVSLNYQRLVYNTLSGVYSEQNNEKNVKDLREELIGKVRASMKAVFDDLVLNNIGDPLGDGTFLFEKGTSKSFHYKNLSGGEKSAFDLLLDLIIKLEYYDDTVFFIDEIDSHMHTSLQGKLTEEIYNIIPDNSQLWLTTHSLGVIRAAKDIERINPGSVAILDFTGYDFDTECNIKPVKIDRVVWEKFLEIALDDYSLRIAPKIIILCEGSLEGTKRKKFDADIYNTILGNTHPDISFVPGGSCADLEQDNNKEYLLLKEVLKSSKVCRLIDRDDKSEQQVTELLAKGLIILKRRHLESYLFDDELITKLVNSTTQEEGKIGEALEIKSKAIQSSISRGNPSDDIKSASGEIYTGLKKLLNLTKCGNETESFMRDTLARLITPDMQIYKELRQEIIQ